MLVQIALIFGLISCIFPLLWVAWDTNEMIHENDKNWKEFDENSSLAKPRGPTGPPG